MRINFSCLLQSLQEMSQDYTDEAGKVIKGSNPFIEEPAQSNTVVDMKGKGRHCHSEINS